MALIKPINAGQGLGPGSAPSTARDASVARGLEHLGGAISQAARVQQRLEEIHQKRERFAAELQWQRTQAELNALHAEALKNPSPAAADFTAKLGEAMDHRYEAFLDALRIEQRQEFLDRVVADRDERLSRAAADEVRERRLWYEGGIAAGVSAAVATIAADPARLDAERTSITHLIGEADLPAARLAELLRDADAALGRAWFAGVMRIDPVSALDALGIGQGARPAAAVAMLSIEERRGLYEQASVALERAQTTREPTS